MGFFNLPHTLMDVEISEDWEAVDQSTFRNQRVV